jgi:hypothetical protein
MEPSNVDDADKLEASGVPYWMGFNAEYEIVKTFLFTLTVWVAYDIA